MLMARAQWTSAATFTWYRVCGILGSDWEHKENYDEWARVDGKWTCTNYIATGVGQEEIAKRDGDDKKDDKKKKKKEGDEEEEEEGDEEEEEEGDEEEEEEEEEEEDFDLSPKTQAFSTIFVPKDCHNNQPLGPEYQDDLYNEVIVWDDWQEWLLQKNLESNETLALSTAGSRAHHGPWFGYEIHDDERDVYYTPPW
ncbi:hypothetical protein PG987_001998 [Apiospora arundinis]